MLNITVFIQTCSFNIFSIMILSEKSDMIGIHISDLMDEWKAKI